MEEKRTINYSTAEINRRLGAIPQMQTDIEGLSSVLSLSVPITDIKARGTYHFNLGFSLSKDESILVKKVVITVTEGAEYVKAEKVTAEGFDLVVSDIPVGGSRFSLTIKVTEQNSGISKHTFAANLVSIPYKTMDIVGSKALTTVGTYEYALRYTPEDANVAVNAVSVTVSPDGLRLKGTPDRTGFVLELAELPEHVTDYSVKVRVSLADGTALEQTKTVNVNAVPSISVLGPDTINARNGSGTSDYTFSYDPSEYSTQVSLISVVSGSPMIKVRNATKDGFTLSVSGLTSEISSTITAVFGVNGREVSVQRTVTVLYEDGYAEPEHRSYAGDILCSDGTIIRPSIAANGYTVDAVELDGKTPIAVCIVPSSHMKDGKGRYMSLDFMDCANPESGNATSRPTMYWGGYNVNLSSLQDLDAAPVKNGAMLNYPSLGSLTMYNPSHIRNRDAEDGLYYVSTSDSEKCPAPFNPDGTVNALYRQGATGDFDGRGNTDKLTAAVTTAWKSGAVINSYNAGNYPAACCCRRYKTEGTAAGDWYLPAMGELGYLMYNVQLVDNILAKLGKIANTNGTYLWSSSEYSEVSARDLYLGLGSVGSRYKNYNTHVRAFLAY